MAKDLKEFREKLVTKMLLAENDTAVIRLTNTAFSTLLKKDLHAHLVARFLDKTICDLKDAGRQNEITNEIERNINTGLSQLLLVKSALTEQTH